MRIVKHVTTLFLLLFIYFISIAQTNIPIGTWRVHTPGRICKTIEKVNNKIYAASENSFIVFNKDDNSVKSLSKIDGLNDAGVSRLKYHAATSTLIIGYTNGNIDLITEDVVTNLNDIKRSSIVGSKRINHIATKGNLAYLSCSFGIVVLDLQKIEIKETYANIGKNGIQIEVYASAFKGDSIFITTSEGIKAGSTLANYNLIDFGNWVSFGLSNGIPTNTTFQSIGAINNMVYATTNKGEVYNATGNQWTLDNTFSFPTQSTVNITFSDNKLRFVHPNKIISVDNNFNKTEIIDLGRGYDVFFESDQLLWLADIEKGIVKIDGVNKSNISPNSPYFNTAFRLKNYTDWSGTENIIVTTGGYDDNGNAKNIPNGIYIFRGGLWENYNSGLGNFPSSIFIENFIESDYSQLDSTLYISSWNGLIKFKRTGPNTSKTVLLTRFNTNNNLIDLFPDGGFYVMFDVKFDKNNVGWTIGSQRTSTSQASLFSFKKDIWNTYNFSMVNGNVTKYPVELLIDTYDNKWIRYPKNNGGGIVVFNENLPVGKQYKYLTDQVGEGKLPSVGTSCFTKDANGAIWIGTDKGVGVYSNPNQILTSTSFDATTPIFENRPLLNDKAVKCITVDGANRKWIGTNAGIWLFNEDGTQEITSFNMDNSPLPSNNIYDIEICRTTGEVFFATDAGIISYRGDATDPLTANNNEASEFSAKVFPNPVTPEFSGQIGISGLPLNTNIKITDINGVLIYETNSNGGTATWNGYAYSGTKAQSGIYLIFATNKDGLQTMVCKFAIVK
jgi:hypothetical protein